VRDAKGKTLRKAAQIVPQQSIEIEFADGRVMANVTGGPGQGDKPAPSKVSEMTIEKPKDERRPSRAARKSDQGSLF